MPWIIAVGVLVLVAGVVGYIIAQKQWGKPVRWKDPSDEKPTQEATRRCRRRRPSGRGSGNGALGRVTRLDARGGETRPSPFRV